MKKQTFTTEDLKEIRKIKKQFIALSIVAVIEVTAIYISLLLIALN